MATKTTGSMTVKSGVNSTVDNPQTYDDVFTTKYTFTEAAGAGANAFKIHSDTATVAISLKGTSGDVLVIDGYSGDYTAKLSGSKLTLDNNNQIITVALAAKSIVKLQFLDGSKDVNLVDKTLGGESLATKTGVLHINGMNSHELTSVTNAVKAALTDTNKKYYATVDAAIISDNAVVKSTALTDKLGKSYATVDAAITSNDAIIAAQTLTDTSVTPNVLYPNLAAAITSNDSAIVSQALNGTGFSNMADFIAAYNKFVNQTLTTFRVETLNPATMQPATAVSVSEGATAYFKVSLTNRGAGDYSVKTMLTGTTATPDNDFVSSLTLDNASIAAGIKFNPITGILTIPASSQSVSAILSTAIKNDTVSPEAGEKVNLALFDAQGTSVAPLGITDIASVTILDVPPPMFSVTPNTGPVSEGATTTFTVSLANHAVGDYSVKVSLTGNNAVLNSDFSALTLDPATPTSIKFDVAKGILTIPADAKTTSVKFNTTINTDNRAETGQSVTFALSQDATNSTNVNTLITPTASATTAVITDTTPAFSVAAGSTTVDKGKAGSFSISLANASTGDYKVNLAATTLNSSILNTLALDSTNSNAGVTFDGSILTIPAATITAANKQPIKAVLTSLTNPIDSTSISLALSNPTGANIAAAPAPVTIGINNVPATLLTKGIDSFSNTNGLPSNANTLLVSDLLTLNTGDSIVDDSATDNDILNITTNSLTVTSTSSPVITNIETINFKSLDINNIDMTKITGVKTFNVKDSTAPVTLTKIPNTSMAFGLGGDLVNDLTVKYTTAPKTTDSLKLTLDKATNASFSVDSAIVIDKGFGFVELSVLNSSNLKLFDGKLSTITISGVGALTVATDALLGVNHIELTNPNIMKFGDITTTQLTTFKAPTNTGGITTGLIQGATGGFTMQLGSGADNIRVQDNAAASTNINDIRLGAGNDSLTFTKGANGNTYISGEDGNDTINIGGVSSSASSINTIDGGNGDDKITVSVSGSYLISGGTGSDVITDGAGSNVIDGGADADTITGGAGNDTITGGTGSDTIYVDSGTDTITDFKVGEDTLIISSGATAKVSFAGNSAVSYATVGNAGILDVTLATISTVIGSTGIDSITGSIGADSIDGGLGNDIINAGDGNDTIIGGDGSDSIDGGNDDDTITGGNGVDTITGGAGNDTISMTLAQLFNTAINNNVVYVTDSIDSINGDNDTDSILITDTENPVNINVTNTSTLSRITNIEQLRAGPNRFPISISVDANNKFNTIDLSNDTNAGGTNIITSIGSSNILTIIGSAGIDQITLGASAPSATITGGSGADVLDINNGILGTLKTNTITDLSGTDTLKVWQYSTVNATVTADYTAASAINAGTINITTAGFVVNMAAETGSSGSISITNTGSATTLVGGAGSNTINGGVGNDTINGGAGSATISGGAGNDMITAGAAGTNSITGGYGDDTIVGSAGVDTINVDYGTDTITNLGTGDVLTVNYYATANATLSGTSPSWIPTSSTINHGILNIATAASTTTATVDLSLVANTGTININASTASGSTTLKGAGAGITNITGGAGNDTIIGGSGADLIVGGAGNDLIYADSGAIAKFTISTAAATTNATDIVGATIVLNIFGVDVTATLTATDTSATLQAAAIVNAINSSSVANEVLASNIAGAITLTSLVDATSWGVDTAGSSSTDGIAAGITIKTGGTPLTSSALILADGLSTDNSTTQTVTTSATPIEILIGSQANITTSNNTITGGAGTDTFVFGKASTTASDTVFNTITDFASSSDIIDYVDTLSIVTNATASSGVAAISSAGIAIFNTADNTLALRIVAVEAAIQTGAATAGQAATFQYGSDAYVFISEGTDGVGTGDQLIKLTGVDLTNAAFDTLTLSGGNATLA